MKILVLLLAFAALCQALPRSYPKTCFNWDDCGYGTCCVKSYAYRDYGYCKPKSIYRFKCLEKPYKPYFPKPEPEPEVPGKPGYCPTGPMIKYSRFNGKACSVDYDCFGYSKCCQYRCTAPYRPYRKHH